MSRFQYQPLPSPRSIRLLRFLSENEPLCQMITVEVEKAPPYVALSYTWGSKELTREILVDGHRVLTMENLGDAINAIYRFAWGKYLAFWADFICIDQSNLEERGHQVRLMNTIYRSAEIVAIWLGPSANNSDNAFDVIKETWKPRFDILLEENRGSYDLAAVTIKSDDPHFTGTIGLPQYKTLEALYHLVNRGWWTRAWVVQEGSVAQTSRTILFCGGRKLDWAHFRAALYIARRLVNGKEHDIESKFNSGLAAQLDYFRYSREFGDHMNLLQVLSLMRRFQCEDARDKVYAALGMAMDVNEDEIIPDYTKEYPKVYTDVARFFIAGHRKSLDVLGYVVRSAPGTQFEHQHNHELPSWVPDWTSSSVVNPLRKQLNVEGYNEYEKVYRASGSTKGEPFILEPQLNLSGSFVDRIRSLSDVCQSGTWEGLKIERSWIPSNSDEPYFNGQTIVEAFNHTLVADVGYSNTDDFAQYLRGFAVDWALIDSEEEHTCAELRRRRTWMLEDMENATYGRRFFRTTRGYMGLAPAAAQIGDDVCVLFGGQVLYVLRARTDDRFEFVGECYVHGMMDGLACEGPWFEPREFVLV